MTAAVRGEGGKLGLTQDRLRSHGPTRASHNRCPNQPLAASILSSTYYFHVMAVDSYVELAYYLR